MQGQGRRAPGSARQSEGRVPGRIAPAGRGPSVTCERAVPFPSIGVREAVGEAPLPGVLEPHTCGGQGLLVCSIEQEVQAKQPSP